jgi:hypothetical protein
MSITNTNPKESYEASSHAPANDVGGMPTDIFNILCLRRDNSTRKFQYILLLKFGSHEFLLRFEHHAIRSQLKSRSIRALDNFQSRYIGIGKFGLQILLR